MEFNYPYHLADLLMTAVFRHAVAKAAISQVRPNPVSDDSSTFILRGCNPYAAKHPSKLEAGTARAPS